MLSHKTITADWEGRAIHYERPVQKLTSFSLKHYQIIFRQYFFGWSWWVWWCACAYVYFYIAMLSLPACPLACFVCCCLRVLICDMVAMANICSLKMAYVSHSFVSRSSVDCILASIYRRVLWAHTHTLAKRFEPRSHGFGTSKQSTENRASDRIRVFRWPNTHMQLWNEERTIYRWYFFRADLPKRMKKRTLHKNTSFFGHSMLWVIFFSRLLHIQIHERTCACACVCMCADCWFLFFSTLFILFLPNTQIRTQLHIK